jgi:hypothetical protein
MDQIGGYDFSSIRSETQENQSAENIQKAPQAFPTGMFIAMLTTGILGIIISPSTLAPIGLISGTMILISIFASLALGGVSGFLGERLIKKKRKLGWIGIVFTAVIILMIAVPIIFVFVAPI